MVKIVAATVEKATPPPLQPLDSRLQVALQCLCEQATAQA
jgi:hypothetical protein